MSGYVITNPTYHTNPNYHTSDLGVQTFRFGSPNLQIWESKPSDLGNDSALK